jgi:hypothetical protein
MMRFLIQIKKTRKALPALVLRFGHEVISGNYADEKSYRLSSSDRLGLRR